MHRGAFAALGLCCMAWSSGAGDGSGGSGVAQVSGAGVHEALSWRLRWRWTAFDGGDHRCLMGAWCDSFTCSVGMMLLSSV